MFFTGVYHSVQAGDGVPIFHGALGHGYLLPSPGTWAPTPTPDMEPGYLPLLLTSGGHHGDLFKLVHLRTCPNQY